MNSVFHEPRGRLPVMYMVRPCEGQQDVDIQQEGLCPHISSSSSSVCSRVIGLASEGTVNRGKTLFPDVGPGIGFRPARTRSASASPIETRFVCASERAIS